MKRFNISYVEIIKNGVSVSSCYENDSSTYGATNEGACRPDIFHSLVVDMVVPKVIPVSGNKVTKMSTPLIDGFDCYYTTRDDDANTVLVCFTREDIPKILPIRVLSELKHNEAHEIDNDNKLSACVGNILDNFHNELIQYKNQNGIKGGNEAEDDMQEVIQIMNDNIDKFLERQERVSLLVDNTSHLNSNSRSFKRKAIKLKERMWWRRMKNYTLMIFAIILCVSAISMFFYLW